MNKNNYKYYIKRWEIYFSFFISPIFILMGIKIRKRTRANPKVKEIKGRGTKLIKCSDCIELLTFFLLCFILPLMVLSHCWIYLPNLKNKSFQRFQRLCCQAHNTFAMYAICMHPRINNTTLIYFDILILFYNTISMIDNFANFIFL